MVAVPAAGASRKADLKIAAVLGAASALATIALFPYLLEMMPERFVRVRIPLYWLLAAQSAQVLVVMGLLAWLGLRMGRQVGLGVPLLQRLLAPPAVVTPARPRPLAALALGTATALVVLLLAHVIDPWLPEMLHPPRQSGAAASAFNGLLASFYGGIVEELQLRLFLMTLLVWVASRLSRGAPGPGLHWLAIIVAALLFGVGHLPAAQHLWGLDAVVVLRTITLNAIVGVACGWLYWRQGLEMAIVAHFGADLVLHVAAPLLAPGALP